MKIANNESVNIRKKQIIYISPEYGYDENINNYAGGLGILAGDYLKEASDQNYPIIAVGLFYKDGYFTQSFDSEFNQISDKAPTNLEFYKYNYIEDNNQTKVFEIDLGFGVLKFKVLKAKVKNIDLYLIDSNVEENFEFANITNMLYTPSRKERLLQEILLGQGAIILLKYLQIPIDILHINEGHAAFALLERINQEVDKTGNFEEALIAIKKTNCFTTHTPIIHGNEEFDPILIEETLQKSSLLRHINLKDFLKMGTTNENVNFSMTALSIRLSNKFNSVSKLHQKVATKMWKVIDKNIQFENITNGIYLNDWIAPELQNMIDFNSFATPDLLNKKNSLKTRIVEEFNLNNYYNKSDSLLELYKNTVIEKDSFIIGFARRFAPYKRADLLFSNIENLKNFIKINPKVILIFSGKAHPADVDGKKIIKDILINIKNNQLQNNIIFIENYNIKIAKSIIWASDLWLNNPIRGLEACGTSGMKAALNGSINFSILDGWWDEAYNEKIGFKIGNRRINYFTNIELSNLIFEDLKRIIKMKNENKGLWDQLTLNSFNTIIKKFSTKRMLLDYYQKLYFFDME